MSPNPLGRTPTTWLRISYWMGAIADGLVAGAMLGQAILGHKSPLTGYEPDIPYRYAMALGGSLMLGWTILLLWADRKPVERRGVLLLTDLVILGLIGSTLFAASAGFMPKGAAIAMVAFLVALFVLFTASYLASRKVEV